MTQLFDAIAGSETGAIIANTILTPKFKNNTANRPGGNQWFADRASEFFVKHQTSLYSRTTMSIVAQIIISILVALLIGIPIYHCLVRCYDPDEFEARKTAMEDFFDKIKELLKRKEADGEDKGESINKENDASESALKINMRKAQQRAQILIESERKYWHKHFSAAVDITRSREPTIEKMEKINQVEVEFKHFIEYYNSKLGRKYIFLTIGCFVLFAGTYGGVSALIYLLESTRHIDKLKDALCEFLPYDQKLSEIPVSHVDDILFTSWDVNNRTPRLFSRWTVKEMTKKTNPTEDHDMTMGQMTVASAANSEFFLPFEVDGKFYISGDNIASSPAYLAYMNAI